MDKLIVRGMLICGHQRFIWVLLCLGLASIADANQKSVYQKSIDEIANEIAEISRELNRSKTQLKTEKEKLASIDQNINEITRELATTQSRITAQRAANTALDAQIAKLNNAQEQDKTALAELLRQRYRQGSPNYLKMLLNQQNPYAVGRLQNYFHYFSKAQHAKLLEIREKIAVGEALLEDKQLLIEGLSTTLQHQEKQYEELGLAKEKRNSSIKELNKKVLVSSEQLKELKQDRKRLNALLEQLAKKAKALQELERRKAQAAASAEEQQQQQQENAKQRNYAAKNILPPVNGGFRKQKGRLKYPVNGTSKYRYGSRLQESGMQAQGTFFNTNGGQPVASIFRGGVLFSGYLKGYGLLIIVDHGDDHISLYGHNEVLYKNVGDQVQTNEVIAKSGVSGGLNSAGLYFEIRHNAEPVDPANWCR